MLVSIVIPAYNEEKVIQQSLEEILAFVKGQAFEAEILVVDDGSKDQTLGKVKQLCALHPQIRSIALDKNRGKGCAVKTGMLAAKGEICGFTDADGATPISELNRILRAFEEKKVDVAIGSRAKKSSETRVHALLHRKGIGRVFNFILSVIVSVYDRHGKRIQDTQCGFKWFRNPAAQGLFSRAKIHGFAFDVEVLYLANQLKYGIEEVSVNWQEKGDSKVNLFVDPWKMFQQVLTIRRIHRSS